MTTAQSYPEGYFGKKPSDRSPKAADLTKLTPYKRHLVAFIESLPQGARVLDMGCGSGKTIRVLQTLRPDLIVEGCDLSDVGEFLPDNVRFTQCSVEEVGERYKADSFDAVICQHVVEHLSSPLGLMRSVQKVVKTGGVFFIETPNWTRAFAPWAHFFFWNDYTHVRIYPKFALIKLFLEHDYVPERVITCATSQWFPTKSKKSVAATQQKSSETPAPNPYFWSTRITRLIARAINPLIPDVLILIGRSHKQ